MNVMCQENLSACHFGHACHIFDSPRLDETGRCRCITDSLLDYNLKIPQARNLARVACLQFKRHGGFFTRRLRSRSVMPTNHLHLQPRSRMNSAICLLTLYVTFFTITEILCSRLYYGHASRSRLDWSGGAARTLHYAVSRKHQSFYLHCETVIIFSKSVARKRTVNLLSRQHTLRGNSWHVNNALRTWAPRTLKRHSSLKDL